MTTSRQDRARAEELYENGDLPAAMEALEKLLDADRDNPDLLSDLGAVCFAAGQYDQSRLHLLRALRLDPDHAEARANLEMVCKSTGRRASDVLEEALSGESSRASTAYGGCFPPSTCGEEYRRLLAVSPEHETVPEGARQCLRQGQWSQAARLLIRSPSSGQFECVLKALQEVNAQPGPETLLALGRGLNDLGLLPEALHVLSLACSLSAHSGAIDSFAAAEGGQYDEQMTSCDLCGDKGEVVHVADLAGHFTGGLISPVRLWRRCGQCGTAFVSPRPAGSVLDEYYQKMVAETGRVERSAAGLETAVALSSGRLDRIRRLHPGGRRLIDIGAGIGLFAATARDVGYEPTVLDLSRQHCEVATACLELQSFCADFLEWDPAEYQADVVTAWEFLEHVPSPLSAARKAASLLREGGIWALATPVSTSTIGRMAKRDSLWWREAEHLHYFSEDYIQGLLAGVGFELLQVRPSSQGQGRLEFYARLSSTTAPRT